MSAIESFPEAAPRPANANRAARRGRRTAVRLCGPVTRGTILEVINMLGVAGWSGELRVRTASATYRLDLTQRALKRATSTAPEHRLGQILVRAGLISQSELDACLRAQTVSEERIGHILVEQGVITREGLFDGLKRQSVEIFFAALAVTSGNFAFLDLEDPHAAPTIALHIPLQQLVLEGARRIDELHESSRRAKAEEAHRPIRRTPVRMESSTKSSGRAVEELIVQFNGVLRGILAAAAPYGQNAAIHSKVAEWLEVSGAGAQVGPKLRLDGSFDPASVRARLRMVDPSRALPGLYQTLHDLTTFLLFAAGYALPRQVEHELACFVTRELRKIRLSGQTAPGGEVEVMPLQSQPRSKLTSASSAAGRANR